MQDHVELVPEGLASVRPKRHHHRERSRDRRRRDRLLHGLSVLGLRPHRRRRRRRQIAGRRHGEGPEAHKGISTPGFPNYFFAVGPNGLVLNVSYFITAEKNVESIVRLLGEKQAAGARAIAVKPEVHRAYNDWMGTRFPLYSWGTRLVTSYYRMPRGRAPFLFPGGLRRVRRSCTTRAGSTSSSCVASRPARNVMRGVPRWPCRRIGATAGRRPAGARPPAPILID